MERSGRLPGAVNAFEAMLMQTRKQIRRWKPLILAALLALVPTSARLAPDLGGPDDEIRIGNIMPYTGPLAAFASIGRAEGAYFDMINERGGINGRKIKFISYDDNSNPRTALEWTRDLVEKENVLLMFSAFGTPSACPVFTAAACSQ